MTRPVAPLPHVKVGIGTRVLLEIDKVDDDDLDLYLEKQLVQIQEENPVLGAVLAINREKTRRDLGEEAALAVLQSEIAVYQALKRQTIFNYRNLFLRAKQFQRSREKRAAGEQ